MERNQYANVYRYGKVVEQVTNFLFTIKLITPHLSSSFRITQWLDRRSSSRILDKCDKW